MMTRAEHLAWCKRRALEYVEAGDLNGGLSSMASDMRKHPDTSFDPLLMMIGLEAVQSGSKEKMRRFINGFN